MLKLDVVEVAVGGVLPVSAMFLSSVTLAWKMRANVSVRLNLMFLSISVILGAALVPSISSGGMR